LRIGGGPGGNREDDVEIAVRQKICLALTFETMPVVATVLAMRLMAARLAALDMAAKRRGAAPLGGGQKMITSPFSRPHNAAIFSMVRGPAAHLGNVGRIH